jgi:hypothetical protein
MLAKEIGNNWKESALKLGGYNYFANTHTHTHTHTHSHLPYLKLSRTHNARQYNHSTLIMQEKLSLKKGGLCLFIATRQRCAFDTINDSSTHTKKQHKKQPFIILQL